MKYIYIYEIYIYIYVCVCVCIYIYILMDSIPGKKYKSSLGWCNLSCSLRFDVFFLLRKNGGARAVIESKALTGHCRVFFG